METKKADLSALKIDRTSKDDNPTKAKYFKFLLGIVAALIIVYLIVIAYQALFNPAIEVKLVTAVMQSQSQSDAVLTANGYVVAQRKAAVASKGMGKLVYLGVVEGDRVVKDQVIARLEDNDIKAQLEQAKATLMFNQADLMDAENTFSRVNELLKSGASTPAEIDLADSRLKRVKASIELAKAQIMAAEVAMENTLIRAPFNGTVLTKNADVGEIVAPLAAGVNSKAAVVTIADMTSLQVEADVSESNIEKILLEQDCEIRLDAYPDNAYPGFVDKIVPTADRAKATVMVKVGFKRYDKRVLPEMSAKVVFLRGAIDESQLVKKQILVVDKSTVVTRNGKQVVYLVRDDKAFEVIIETGKDMGSYIEVKSGLMNGDRVIEKVSDKILDGVKVTIK
ncbi:MAG: efflux RND transporter periplasmic adaptor subunit [Ignavibacteria bacterium]|nr:efflux RND transporter periplasmic adaptor subunit [Ignavibacteria bacterium]